MKFKEHSLRRDATIIEIMKENAKFLSDIKVQKAIEKVLFDSLNEIEERIEKEFNNREEEV